MILDPAALVWRHSLGRQLSTDPIGFFRENDLFAKTERSQGSSNATQSSTNNQNIR
jgi:hypothetical protein